MNNKLVYSTLPAQNPLFGELRVPGDKSISHRAVIFSSLANGTSEIRGLLEGEDVLATLAAFRAMGVDAVGPVGGTLTINGVGMRGLKTPDSDLDMGNSGTAMRLMAGLLAAQDFPSKLIGDESLSSRPMRRVTVPLTSMGALCATGEDGSPPIHIRKVDRLTPINYKMPVASAQVKSAILLAGMYADGKTSVTEPAPTRNHTERMLSAYGYPCEAVKESQHVTTIAIDGGGELSAADIDVPADISSAAFFMVAASIVPGSELRLSHVGVNPTRTGVIDVLREMGASIEFANAQIISGEPVADLIVRYTGLQGIEVDPKYGPLAIDEFPVLCVAAACAKGVTKISGVEELRHKESDRISSMVTGLRTLGIDVTEHKDGLDIVGGELLGGEVDSFHDHRIAMSFAVAGATAKSPIVISNCDNVATSFPNFVELTNQVGLTINAKSIE